MAQDGKFDPWSTDLDLIPPPVSDPHETTFAFIPSETRQPVSASNPFARSVVRVLAYRAGESDPRKGGSAVIVRPDLLITAAHVVFDPTISGFGGDRQGYAQGVRIQSPFLAISAPLTQKFVAARAYVQEGDPDYDIAVIKLMAPIPDAEPIPPQVVSDSDAQNGAIAVFGFPELSTALFRGRGHCVGSAAGAFYHTADATEGESGGAFLFDLGGTAVLAGLHRAGPGETPSGFPPSCGSVRLTHEAINWIGTRGAQLS